jgi:hypothetical protein
LRDIPFSFRAVPGDRGPSAFGNIRVRAVLLRGQSCRTFDVRSNRMVGFKTPPPSCARRSGSAVVYFIDLSDPPAPYVVVPTPAPNYQLRMQPEAVKFVRAFLDAGKPVAAICHAPWTLIEAGVVKGRTLTSWPSVKTDLVNAGANWVDQEVVVDNGLVTSRKPDDIPAFNEKMLEEFAEGTHRAQKATAQ